MSHPHEPSPKLGTEAGTEVGTQAGSDAASVAADDEYLADRYGHGRARGSLGAGARVAIGVALAAGVAVAAWFAVEQQRQDPVSFTDVGFSIVSAEQVDVTFDVSMPPGMRATCTLVALNPSYAQVGALQVQVGPNEDRTARYTAEVRTTERATTGVVDDCVVEP